MKVWDRDVSFSPCRSGSTSQRIEKISVPSGLVIKLVLLVHINLIHQGLCKHGTHRNHNQTDLAYLARSVGARPSELEGRQSDLRHSIDV